MGQELKATTFSQQLQAQIWGADLDIEYELAIRHKILCLWTLLYAFLVSLVWAVFLIRPEIFPGSDSMGRYFVGGLALTHWSIFFLARAKWEKAFLVFCGAIYFAIFYGLSVVPSGRDEGLVAFFLLPLIVAVSRVSPSRFFVFVCLSVSLPLLHLRSDGDSFSDSTNGLMLLCLGAALLLFENFSRHKDFESILSSRQIARERSRFASIGFSSASISHEIKNPITIALGSLELILSKHLRGRLNDEQLVKGLNRSVLALNRILEIAERVRARSKPALQAKAGSVSVSEVIEKSMQSCMHALNVKSIQLHVEIEDGAELIGAHQLDIEQILINLIKNAAECFPVGGQSGKWIRIAAHCGNDDLVYLEVSNNGPEMLPEEKASILNHQRSSKGEAGMGLGLIIAREMAQYNGGELSFEEQADLTTFVLSVPRPAQSSL